MDTHLGLLVLGFLFLFYLFGPCQQYFTAPKPSDAVEYAAYKKECQKDFKCPTCPVCKSETCLKGRTCMNLPATPSSLEWWFW